MLFYFLSKKKKDSLWGGYASLGLGPFDFLNRRNLFVGTLLTFLSRSGVEVERAETNVNQQSGETKEQTCVRMGVGAGGAERLTTMTATQTFASTLKATECIARPWRQPHPASVFCSKYLWFFFPPHVLFVHTMHIKYSVANNVQITDQYIFCSF